MAKQTFRCVEAHLIKMALPSDEVQGWSPVHAILLQPGVSGELPLVRKRKMSNANFPLRGSARSETRLVRSSTRQPKTVLTKRSKYSYKFL